MAYMNLLAKATKLCRYVVDFRVDHWLDWAYQKKNTLYIWRTVKPLFFFNRVQSTAPTETFTQAVDQCGLTPEALRRQAQRYLKLSIFFLIFAILLSAYGTFLWVACNAEAAVTAITLAILSISFAFRYHFWYFQITQKKLGCTLKAWKQFLAASLKQSLFRRIF